MAEPDQIKNEEQINRLYQERIGLAKDMEEVYGKELDLSVSLLESTRSLTTELRETIGLRSRISEDDKSILGLSRQITTQFRKTNSELREEESLHRNISKEQKLSRQLQGEILLISKKMGSEYSRNYVIAQDLVKTETEIGDIRNKSEEVLRDIMSLERKSGERLSSSHPLREKLKLHSDIEEKLANERVGLLDIADEDTKRLAILLSIAENLDLLSDIRKRGVEEQNKINDAIGITGALLDNIDKIGFRAFGGIGINLATFGDELKKAKKEVDELGESLALTAAGEGLSDYEKKVQTLEAALPGIRRAVIKGLVDPLTSLVGLTKVVKAFTEINQATSELTRLLGKDAVQNINKFGTLTGNLNTNFKEVYELATQLTQELGVNAAVAFDSKLLIGASELRKLLGLTVEEAGAYAELTQITGGDIEDNISGIVDGVNNFNKLNRNAINHRTIMSDVAKTSKAVALNLGNSTQALAEANATARSMGLELSDLQKIAEGLLDFERTIEAELQAQLISGKQINLAKAAEYAMVDDLAGVGREVMNQEAVREAFATRNVIAQQSIADALNLSREELAKIAFSELRRQQYTDQQIQQSIGLTAEQFKQLSINERLENIMANLTEFAAEYGASIAIALGLFKGLEAIQTVLATLDMFREISARRRAKAEAKSAASTITQAGASAVDAASKAAGSVSAIPAVGGFIAAGIAGGLLGLLLGKLTSIDDGMISPSGGLIVSGQKGSYKLNENDYVIAGTNLGNPAPNSNENTKVFQMMERKLNTLIEAVQRRGDVYLDKKLVGVIGEKQVLNSTNFI